jgi:hypothetical protein
MKSIVAVRRVARKGKWTFALAEYDLDCMQPVLFYCRNNTQLDHLRTTFNHPITRTSELPIDLLAEFEIFFLFFFSTCALLGI